MSCAVNCLVSWVPRFLISLKVIYMSVPSAMPWFTRSCYNKCDNGCRLTLCLSHTVWSSSVMKMIWLHFHDSPGCFVKLIICWVALMLGYQSGCGETGSSWALNRSCGNVFEGMYKNLTWTFLLNFSKTELTKLFTCYTVSLRTGWWAFPLFQSKLKILAGKMSKM